MSLAYCAKCLERTENCICKDGWDEVVYGESRVNYLKGYRDAKKGKENRVLKESTKKQ